VPWVPISPESIVSAIYKFVCKGRELLTDAGSHRWPPGSVIQDKPE
jgi:hypothetical protein